MFVFAIEYTAFDQFVFWLSDITVRIGYLYMLSPPMVSGKESGDETPTVIVSTASPYKFAKDVCIAIDEKYRGQDAFALMDELEKLSGVPIPAPVKDIEKREVLHNNLCEREKIKHFVKEQLR